MQQFSVLVGGANAKGMTTAVNEIRSDNLRESVVYDLQGRRVTHVVLNRLYII